MEKEVVILYAFETVWFVIFTDNETIVQHNYYDMTHLLREDIRDAIINAAKTRLSEKR